MDIITKHCHDQVLDIRDVCDMFIDYIGQIKECEKNISAKCGIHVTFSEEAIDTILEQLPLSHEKIKSLCETMGSTFEYGLGLLQQKKGVDHVVIPRSGIKKPDQYINNLVRDFFRT